VRQEKQGKNAIGDQLRISLGSSWWWSEARTLRWCGNSEECLLICLITNHESRIHHMSLTLRGEWHWVSGVSQWSQWVTWELRHHPTSRLTHPRQKHCSWKLY